MSLVKELLAFILTAQLCNCFVREHRRFPVVTAMQGPAYHPQFNEDLTTDVRATMPRDNVGTY